jgi:hypothetical protein
LKTTVKKILSPNKKQLNANCCDKRVPVAVEDQMPKSAHRKALDYRHPGHQKVDDRRAVGSPAKVKGKRSNSHHCRRQQIVNKAQGQKKQEHSSKRRLVFHFKKKNVPVDKNREEGRLVKTGL